jgi:DNA-directed RNA polymerase specialized sigma24 family protein
MGTVPSIQREKFEEDTFPHLEALWRTALWLTMRWSYAEGLVLKTMTQAYESWLDSGDSAGSKARLFRILTNEFAGNGDQRHQPGRFLPQQCPTVAKANDGGRHYADASIDRQELLLLTKISHMSVKGTIARLRVQSRLIMILLFRERFSYEDVAYITGLRKDSVKSILGRLRRRIPRYLAQHTECFLTAAASRPTFKEQRPSADDGRC